jgi:hypothetical protein
MLCKLLAIGLLVGFAPSVFAAVDSSTAHPSLTAEEIVNRNEAARGGLQAWRAVHTLSESGTLGAGGDQRQALSAPAPAPPGKHLQPLPSSPRLAQEAKLPFLLEMERPRKMRLEVQFKGQTALQVYDGANGWKVRPYLNRIEVEPYTADELKLAAMQSELDGPLVDYAAKGTRVELDGMETVENRPTYKLKLTTRSGQLLHVWIDAQSFLEAKVEGQPRRLDGKMHSVEIYYRDYRSVEGLQIPFLLETHVLPLHGAGAGIREVPFPPEQIVVDKVVVNPKLEAARFTKPQVETASVRH